MFQILESNQISVDVVATSEISVSLTLDPKKLEWSRQQTPAEMQRLQEEFARIADVSVSHDYAILSLIGNVNRNNVILELAFRTLGQNGINVKMVSQGASKVNISILVESKDSERALKCLHTCFFESS